MGKDDSGWSQKLEATRSSKITPIELTYHTLPKCIRANRWNIAGF